MFPNLSLSDLERTLDSDYVHIETVVDNLTILAVLESDPPLATAYADELKGEGESALGGEYDTHVVSGNVDELKCGEADPPGQSNKCDVTVHGDGLEGLYRCTVR